jgi:hypothetical protein
MNVQHVNVKIFVEGEFNIDLERFIEVFHGWVSEQSMDELLIDVADYRHVPMGPGVVLVGFDADYALNMFGDRPGLLYNRKAPCEGENLDRIRQAFWSAAHACQLLEAEFSDLKFSRQEFELFINDRALAPNTSDTHEAFRPELEAFLRNLCGDGEFHIEHNSNPRSRFGVTVKLATPINLANVAAA